MTGTDKLRKRNRALWLLRKAGLVVLGILLYAICINMFSGYPQINSGLLNWIAVVAISIFAGVVWYLDERRHGDTDDD